MESFEIIFYEEMNGKHPVEDFISDLDVKMRAKMLGLLEILEEKGHMLREPYSKHLDDGIFELRCQAGNNISRVLYFFYTGRKIIVTNGFIKKRQRTPKSELNLAKQRRYDFMKRINFNENA